MQDVLKFWFEELAPAQWWVRDQALDRQISERFGELHRRAVQGELYGWRKDVRGRLAEVIVLDQFSRNIHRDSPLAFAADSMALALAQEVVAAGLDQRLSPLEKSVLYLPWMHSESLLMHEVAMQLYQAPGLEENLQFEIRHKDIIERFGRYPHRNTVLGRQSTPEEIAFLKQPGSSF
jgi:uncharacterized protein (DUF924 family)